MNDEFETMCCACQVVTKVDTEVNHEIIPAGSAWKPRHAESEVGGLAYHSPCPTSS